MAPEDRDRSFERALARQLRRGEPLEACPDAETLAAYHERSLAPEELHQWKTHIAACARCQEVLAQVESTDHIFVGVKEEDDIPVFEVPFLTTEALPKLGRAANARQKNTSAVAAARSEPVAPEAAEKMTEIFAPARQRAKSWRWLVPAGAIAAGLLVWGGVRQIRVMQRPVEVAVNRPQATSEPPSAPGPQANPSNALENTRRAVPEDKGAVGRFAAKPETKTQANPLGRKGDELGEFYADKAPRTAPAGGAAPGAAGARALDLKKLPAPGEKAAAPAAEAPGRSEEPVSAKSKEENPAKQDREAEVKISAAAMPAPPQAAAAPTPSPPTAPQPAPAREGNAQEKDKASRGAEALYETVQVAPLVSNSRAAPFGVQTASSSATRAVRAPGGKTIWILGDDGVILRSSDGGTTWASQSSGVSATLVAGSAPSETVCWVVGKQGTILLTTDGGEHWQKVASPTTGDLLGVSARGAGDAAVWSDLRLPRYVTRDGGKTWEHPDTK